VIALSLAAQAWPPSNEAPQPVTGADQQVSARVGELLLMRRPSSCPRCRRFDDIGMCNSPVPEEGGGHTVASTVLRAVRVPLVLF
jgi:hypothetical protein